MYGTLRVTTNIVRYLVLAVLMLSFSGCDVLLRTPDRQLLEIKKDVVSSTIKANKVLLAESLKNGIITAEGSRSIEMEEAGGLTEEEIDEYLDNPDQLIDDLLEEENGEVTLDYLYTIFTSDDSEEILEAARPLIGEEDYTSLKEQAQQIKDDINRGSSSRSMADDNLAHIVGGAGVAFLVSGFAYIFTPSIRFVAKLGCIVACSIAAAAFAGFLKELVDGTDGVIGTQAEWKDFFNTVGGGIIANVVSLFPAVLVSKVITGLLCLAIGIVCLDQSGVLSYLLG